MEGREEEERRGEERGEGRIGGEGRGLDVEGRRREWGLRGSEGGLWAPVLWGTDAELQWLHSYRGRRYGQER